MSGIAIKLETVNFEDKNFGVATIEEPARDMYLQYIEGDGQAYIETKKEHNCYRSQTSDIAGNIPTDAPKIEIECSLPYVSSDFSTKGILGTNGHHSVAMYYAADTTLSLNGGGAKVNMKVAGDFTKKTKITYGSIKSYINDTELIDNTNMANPYRLNAWPDDSIRLFYIYILNQDFYTRARIYSYRVYHGDTLVLDLKPFKKADGTVCMKDDLTNEYYYNSGSGSFIAGPKL